MFLVGLKYNVLLYSSLRYKSNYLYVSCLTYPMTSLLCLFVLSWIPVWFIEDHVISWSQIDPYAPNSSWTKKHQTSSAVVEVIYLYQSILSFVITTHSHIDDIVQRQSLLNYIKRMWHLCEDKYFWIFFFAYWVEHLYQLF